MPRAERVAGFTIARVPSGWRPLRARPDAFAVDELQQAGDGSQILAQRLCEGVVLDVGDELPRVMEHDGLLLDGVTAVARAKEGSDDEELALLLAGIAPARLDDVRRLIEQHLLEVVDRGGRL